MQSLGTRMLRCVVLVLLALGTHTAKADFQFSIGNGTGLVNPILVLPGSSVSIPVYIEVQPAPFDQLRGYDLAIDFGGDSFGLPSAFPVHSSIGGSAAGAFFPTTSFTVDNSTAPFLDSISQPVNWDVKYSGTFSGTQTVTAQRKLFDIVFTVPGSATAGIYAINLVTTTQPSGLSTVTLPSGASSFQFNPPWNGSIQVVPEPNSFLLASLAFAGLGLVRRRNRRQ